MNPAREFQKLIGNFCEGLECLQGYCGNGYVDLRVEDGDLCWISVEKPVQEEDAEELKSMGFECETPREWFYRLMIPTAPCADRLNSEAEVAELHAMY